MWLRKRAGLGARRARALVGLGGCTVRPLYATGAGERGPQADLPAINVQEPTTRTEQVFRNTLLFGLRGGADGADTRYGLSTA